MENLELYDKCREVPKEAQKQIKGGRLSGMTDINPMWRIKKLTEEFGPCGIGWYYIPTRKWMEVCGKEVAAFVDIELYVKFGEEWSKPINGTGGSKFATNESKGTYMSDECYKMATTDALSVACKQLGIGANIYFSSDKSKYDSVTTSEPEVVKIDKAGLQAVQKEMERTGITSKTLLHKYHIRTLNDMTFAQFEDCMKNFKATPDKIDPAKIAQAEFEAPFA